MLYTKSLRELLRANGYKLTNQRLCVIDVLQENTGRHMTVEEIYMIVKKNSPEIGLSTVYRTMQLLQDLKLINTLNLDDGFVRYEVVNHDESHQHHHLICEVCGGVTEVEGDLLDAIEEDISNKYHFSISNHVLKFYGTCNKCNQSSVDDK